MVFREVILHLAVAFFVVLTTTRAGAFSLLGPFSDWMSWTNGYYNEIGGPMNINEGYRWNVPVVTYGFDKSFTDYFGSNGVAAVEGAIQILNDLPAASSLVLSNYPFQSQRINYEAQSQNLYDLKSMTLSLLIEQMGLAQPTRNVFDLRRWIDPIVFSSQSPEEYYWPQWFIPDFIIERNFDPETYAPSHYVNDILHTGEVIYDQGNFSDVWEYPVNPLEVSYTAVADRSVGLGYSYYIDYTSIPPGIYFTGLTRDDVGGLRYLLHANNVNFEYLLQNVRGCGSNATFWVDGGWRPGVDKISFMRHPMDSATGQFSPATNRFIDTFIADGVTKHQQLERVVYQPDFLFTADDLTRSPYLSFSTASTDTHNWVNNADLNGNGGGAGPGVIQPSVGIIFHKLGPTVESDDNYPVGNVRLSSWASFNELANTPIIYPNLDEGDADHLSIRFRLYKNDYRLQMGEFLWYMPLSRGQTVSLQTSTNLKDWASVDIETNLGGIIEWQHASSGPQRFFRALPQ